MKLDPVIASSLLPAISSPLVSCLFSKGSGSMDIGSTVADGALDSWLLGLRLELLARVRSARALRSLFRIKPHSLSFMRYALVLYRDENVQK